KAMIVFDDVGAFPAAPTAAGIDVTFGLYLPGIDAANGYDVRVRVIHAEDRFDPAIQTMDYSLTPVAAAPNNLWRPMVHIPRTPGTHFGQPGSYLYRYQLRQSVPGQPTPRIVTPQFTDPFARATDVGQLSAFETPGFSPAFAWTDAAWKVPDL